MSDDVLNERKEAWDNAAYADARYPTDDPNEEAGWAAADAVLQERATEIWWCHAVEAVNFDHHCSVDNPRGGAECDERCGPRLLVDLAWLAGEPE